MPPLPPFTSTGRQLRISIDCTHVYCRPWDWEAEYFYKILFCWNTLYIYKLMQIYTKFCIKLPRACMEGVKKQLCVITTPSPALFLRLSAPYFIVYSRLLSTASFLTTIISHELDRGGGGKILKLYKTKTHLFQNITLYTIQSSFPFV